MASATAKSCSAARKYASSKDNARAPKHTYLLMSSRICRYIGFRSRLITPSKQRFSRRLPLRTTLPPNSSRWKSARLVVLTVDRNSRTLMDAPTRTRARMLQPISRKHKSPRQSLSATPSAITENARRPTASTLTPALQPSPQLKRSKMASSF